VALVNQLGGGCGNGGLLGGLFGNNCNRNCGSGGMETAALLTAMSAMNAPKSGGCSDLQAEIAQLRAEKYADGIVAQVYKANRDEKDALGDRLLEKYIEPISKEIADMRVREAQTGAAVDCLAKSTSMRFDSVYREIDCAKKECGAAIALEGERRINGDNAIMCYVQGTYVPGKLVMPRDAICPEVMQRYNSWTAPTTPAPDTQAVTGSVQSQTN
jgi:hypothetical protein